jgi:Domain of unknown function (DUF4136)
MKALFAMLMLSLPLGGAAAMTPADYRVKVTVDKHTDFSALHTYAWTRGFASLDPELDTFIVAAIERELASVGLIRQETEPADIVVSYGTVRRSDIDVGAKRDRSSGVYPEISTGTFNVLIREAYARREILRARAEVPLDVDIAQLEQYLDAIIARIFAHYPTRVADSP